MGDCLERITEGTSEDMENMMRVMVVLTLGPS